MSGDVCQPHPQGKTYVQSKIPVSSQCSNRSNRNTRVRGNGGVQNGPRVLHRGHSFMERGEGKTNVRPGAVAQRPQNLTTEPRNSVALQRATGVTPQTPTRIRSLSLSLSNRVTSPKTALPKTPPSSPNNRNQFCRDWDLDSVTSTASGLSVASCDHASVAHNGTTYSGRSKKYVVHCPEHSGATNDYLTPTQRAHKQVKRLKLLLHQTQKELDSKDTDILKLTKEVVELRLYKAALISPEDKSSSSDGVTVREVIAVDASNSIRGIELESSCTDSGHYEDLCNSSVHSKESGILEESSIALIKVKTADVGVSVNLGPRDVQSEHQRLIVEYERRLQELVKTHEEECHQMKQKHNDKVDELLQRLSEVNTRYWELVPDLDSAKERIKELEEQLEEACKKLEEEENKHKENYLKMYNQGIEAAKLEHDRQVLEKATVCTSRVSVPELLHQLEVTQNELEKVKDLQYTSPNNMQPLLSAKEAVTLWVLGARKAMYRQLIEARSKNKIDPEITLQFLKSAIYYFLTDKENNQGHLRAIQSILGFTTNEISIIDKARMT